MRYHEELKYIYANITDNENEINNGTLSLKDAIGKLPDLKYLFKLRVKPFRFYAKKLISKFGDIELAINTGNLENVKEQIIKTYLISKTFVFQKKLQDNLFIMRFLDNDHVSTANFISSLETLLDFLQSREVFPEIEIDTYKAIYDNIINNINTKISEYRNLKRKGTSKLKKQKLKTDYINFLQSFETNKIQKLDIMTFEEMIEVLD